MVPPKSKAQIGQACYPGKSSGWLARRDAMSAARPPDKKKRHAAQAGVPFWGLVKASG
jgi:hypothetical protein